MIAHRFPRVSIGPKPQRTIELLGRRVKDGNENLAWTHVAVCEGLPLSKSLIALQAAAQKLQLVGGFVAHHHVAGRFPPRRPPSLYMPSCSISFFSIASRPLSAPASRASTD